MQRDLNTISNIPASLVVVSVCVVVDVVVCCVKTDAP